MAVYKLCTTSDRVIKSSSFLLVMEVLNKPLQDLDEKYILMACISDDERLHKFLVPLCANLMKIDIGAVMRGSAERTWLKALDGWLASNAKDSCLLDVVKAVLLLKNDGFVDTVDQILDSLGSKIEDEISIKF